jgi:UDP-N-acetyl-D-mannosaminuronate dehydrogenase
MKIEYSVSPDGEKFPLPAEKDYGEEFSRLKKIVAKQKKMKREIVVVMGVGFVGAAMAAVIADTEDKKGKPSKFVIGMQRPSVRSYWKIPVLNKGVSPVTSEDIELAPMIERCVLEKQTLTATFSYDALSLADTVVVDIQCDYHKEDLGNIHSGFADMSPLEESLAIMAEHISPDALVLIETTVAPGISDHEKGIPAPWNQDRPTPCTQL